MSKLSSQKTKEIIEFLDSLKIPFSGGTVASKKKKYHVSPFPQISISGIGPVFYINKKNQKIYTLLQRRFKDNFQWWFPGGYVELPPAQHGFFLENFEKIKNATIDELYKNSIGYGSWQKAKKEVNDPKSLEKLFKKHGVKWPKEIDANWQLAWQREVLEETGVDLNKFPKKIILDFKFNHTLMIGAERDRLTNIDGKFCAFLGELEKEPKTKPDAETEELRWIALDEIDFDKKKKNYFAWDKIVNLYTVTLIEEALFEVICHELKRISKIKNPITQQEISRFNTPQNLQSFLLENISSSSLTRSVDDLVSSKTKLKRSSAFQAKDDELKEIHHFLSWKFGELEIGENLCGKKGDWLYKASITICKFVQSNKLYSKANFTKLNNLLK